MLRSHERWLDRSSESQVHGEYIPGALHKGVESVNSSSGTMPARGARAPVRLRASGNNYIGRLPLNPSCHLLPVFVSAYESETYLAGKDSAFGEVRSGMSSAGI